MSASDGELATRLATARLQIGGGVALVVIGALSWGFAVFITWGPGASLVGPLVIMGLGLLATTMAYGARASVLGREGEAYFFLTEEEAASPELRTRLRSAADASGATFAQDMGSEGSVGLRLVGGITIWMVGTEGFMARQLVITTRVPQSAHLHARLKGEILRAFEGPKSRLPGAPRLVDLRGP